jgi:hypothetical protein
MKVDTDKLKTFKTYSKEKGVTVTAVQNWVKENKIKSVRIDGRWFVID